MTDPDITRIAQKFPDASPARLLTWATRMVVVDAWPNHGVAADPASSGLLNEHPVEVRRG
jgi:hypothetical protein